MPYKIFVGNIPAGSDTGDLQAMFEQYGDVVESDIVSNFGFVHMADESAAKQAIQVLHQSNFNGGQIRCELSTAKTQGRKRAREDGDSYSGGGGGGRGGGRGGGGGGGGGRVGPHNRGHTFKIFIGNIAPDSDETELKSMFEQFGVVSECDIVSNFGFVHMQEEDAAKNAINVLNLSEFNGSEIRCELSTANTQGRKKARDDDDDYRGGSGSRGGGRGRGGRGGGRGASAGRSSGGYAREALPPLDRSDPYAYRTDPFTDPYIRQLLLRDPYVRDLIDTEMAYRDSLTESYDQTDRYAGSATRTAARSNGAGSAAGRGYY